MLADYQAFLEDQLKMYLNNTNAKVAIAKTAEQTGLSINMGKLAPKGRSSTTVKKPVSSQLIDMSPYLDELQKKAKELSESIFDEKSNKRLISFANGVQDIANKLNEIDPEVGNVVMGFADMAGVIGTIGANFKKADGVWKNMSFEDKFSAISMVASITIGTLNKIVTAAKEAKAEEEEYVRAMIQLQNDYNISLNETLRLRSDGKSIFYVDYEAQINDAVAARESAMLELNKQLDNITKKGKWGDKVTQYSWGIATGSKTYWFDLLDKYPQLINAQGEFDKSLAESILKNERLNKDTKQYLENAIAWYDQLEESQKQINDSLESMVGSLGNDLYDALVSSFEAGEDAAQAFGNTVGGIMKNTARQMAFNTIMGPYFDQLEERMKASYDLVSGDMNIIDDLQWFSGIKDTVLPMINDAFKSIDDMVGTTAASMTDPNSLSGAVKGVSEETASIVAGQMNAIRINQAESLKMMNQSVAHMAEVAANTRYNHYLESIDNRLARIETSDPLRAKGL